MKTNIFLLLLAGCFAFGLGSQSYAADPQNVELRAAIDVGSGATRMKIAEVDPVSHKILTVLYSKEYAIPYQAHLARSGDNMLDPEIKTLGLKSIHHFKDVADHYGVQKIVVVATSAFRTANNAQEFVQHVEAITGVKVHIIDQDLEGVLGFSAAAAMVPYPMDDIVVWDIGGGSLQLTSLTHDDKFHVYKGPVGSEVFKNYIIDKAQGKDSKKIHSPNPMTIEDMQQAIKYGEQLAQPVEPFLKAKIAEKGTHVVAVGSVFQYGIANLVGKNTIWQEELQDKIFALKGKDDAALGNGTFVSVSLSNPLYVLGMMKALNINPVIVTEINNTDGALTYAPFWESPVQKGTAAPMDQLHEEPVEQQQLQLQPATCP